MFFPDCCQHLLWLYNGGTLRKPEIVIAASLIIAALLSSCVAQDASGFRTATPLRVDSYEQFDAVASELPLSLSVALRRDTGQSASEYLAMADLMERSADAIDFLLAEGRFEPTEVYLRNGELRVLTTSISEEELARSVGGIPTSEAFVRPVGSHVSANEVRRASDVDAEAAEGSLKPALEGGLPLGVGGTDKNLKFMCTVGFMGYRASDGAPRLLTSGECANQVKGVFYTAVADKAGDSSLLRGVAVGRAEELYEKSQPDGLAILTVNDYGENVAPRATVSTWGGGQGAPTAGTPMKVRGVVKSPAVGATVCKSAVQTGWTCGVITGFSPGQAGVGMKKYENVNTNLCAAKGEVGSPGLIGNLALGILTNNTWGGSCDQKDQLSSDPYSSFIPFNGKLSSQGGLDISDVASFEPMIRVDAPVVTVRPVMKQLVMSGTLANAPTNQRPYYVRFKPEGGAEIRATVIDGKWSLTVPSADGTFKYQLWASTGKWSKSAVLTGSLTTGQPILNG